MYIHILHACLGVYRCRSVGHFHVVGLGCARARLRWVFSSSLLVVVCLGKKKGSLLRRPLWIVASPIPRTSCSTYATRPCLPPSKMGETPPLSPTHPMVCPTPFLPHTPIENTRAPDFSRAAGRWGGGRCLLGRTLGEAACWSCIPRAHVS